jgi:hypothetical protein
LKPKVGEALATEIVVLRLDSSWNGCRGHEVGRLRAAAADHDVDRVRGCELAAVIAGSGSQGVAAGRGRRDRQLVGCGIVRAQHRVVLQELDVLDRAVVGSGDGDGEIGTGYESVGCGRAGDLDRRRIVGNLVDADVVDDVLLREDGRCVGWARQVAADREVQEQVEVDVERRRERPAG